MSNKLSPLFNSTSALLEFQIWSDATSHAIPFKSCATTGKNWFELVTASLNHVLPTWNDSTPWPPQQFPIFQPDDLYRKNMWLRTMCCLQNEPITNFINSTLCYLVSPNNESFSLLESELHNLPCWSPKQKCALSYAIPFYTMYTTTWLNRFSQPQLVPTNQCDWREALTALLEISTEMLMSYLTATLTTRWFVSEKHVVEDNVLFTKRTRYILPPFN